MSETHFQPITVRLTRAILMWGMASALVVGACQGVITWREAGARLRASLQVQTQALAPSLAEALWNVEHAAAKTQLDAALTIPGAGYLAVLGAQGTVVVESGELALSSQPPAVLVPVVWTSNDKTSVSCQPPKGCSAGHLKVVVDQAFIERQVATRVAEAVVPCLLLTAVVLTATLLVVRRRLQRPMREMADFVNRLGADRLDERLQLSQRSANTRDEMDLMAAGFSALQDRVAEHVRELDARVADRTEQLQTALDKLKVLAITDPLTGCHNRLAFSQKYPEALAHAERYGRPLSLVFCDVDRFKSINDNHGHPVGDQVLAAMGHCLRDALRASSDWVARYGGEEFVLVLPETSLSQAQDVAERLRRQIEQTLLVTLPNGGALRVTASLGVAEYRPGERGEDLLTRADEQLYLAKQAGRNQVQPPLAVLA